MQNNARKNIIYSIILLLVVFGVYLYRQNQEAPVEEIIESDRITVSGKTMGTTYRVVYLDGERRDLKASIDSVLKKSQEVYKRCGGAFDPTVGPLVNVWGFGPEGATPKDSIDINQLLPLVGFDKISFDENMVRKSQPEIYLDFSAIAKGYAVDVVASLLEERGISNMLVEIGGELVARGVNDKGEIWKVGINQPDEKDFTNELFSIVALDNKALATSGNYRNYYEIDSVRYSHTIDPRTGYPVQHGLLSATVVAPDCMTADAYATALMVMGTENAILLLDQLEELEAFLIYNDSSGVVQTYISESLKPYISNVAQ